MPPLIEIVKLLTSQLGCSGTVAEVIAAGCAELNVVTEGKGLSQQAKECWEKLMPPE